MTEKVRKVLEHAVAVCDENSVKFGLLVAGADYLSGVPVEVYVEDCLHDLKELRPQLIAALDEGRREELEALRK